MRRVYGTVGNRPAFSCASRAALSPASWVGFSFEWNVPDDPPVAPLAELAALEAVVDAFVAALLAVGANSVAATPPVSIDPPTIAAIARLLCRIFMTFAFLSYSSRPSDANTTMTTAPGPHLG
jgi:hypothetical protein